MQVTLDDFMMYRELCKKAVRLTRSIENLEKAHGKTFRDKVNGSLKYFPYTEAHYAVVGRIDNTAKIEAAKDELQECAEEAKEILENRITPFLKTIPNDKKDIREALEFYYLEGMTYSGVANNMGLQGDGSGQMQKARTYVLIKST